MPVPASPIEDAGSLGQIPESGRVDLSVLSRGDSVPEHIEIERSVAPSRSDEFFDDRVGVLRIRRIHREVS